MRGGGGSISHLKPPEIVTYVVVILFLCSCTGWQLAVNEGYTELPTQSVGDFLGGTFIDNPKARAVYSHRKKILATFPFLAGSLVSDIPAGDGNVANLFLQWSTRRTLVSFESSFFQIYEIYNLVYCRLRL